MLMPLHPEWSDIALRLLCALTAGFFIGLDRGEHGRPAGLRTTMLVALAACLAMLQANVLLSLSGKTAGSFVNLDVMRLPLGILSGMGFIGAGAIVRRDNLVLGVTTAATLWFITVVGLCFGGGQYPLGISGSLLGLGIISGLRHYERRIKRDHKAALIVVTTPGGPPEQDILTILTAHGYAVRSCALVYTADSELSELTCQVDWSSRETDNGVPEFVRSLRVCSGVVKVGWHPERT
jgi:putative Mg2+ transporter-C (MgtC) family protein